MLGYFMTPWTTGPVVALTLVARNDCKHQALVTMTGFYGSQAELTLLWLQNNGATSNALNDAWSEYLDLQGVTAGHVNDRWYAWLGSLGYSDSDLSARFNRFWCDRI